MKEVEILVKTLDKKEVVSKKLRRVARFVGDVKVKDAYYYDPLRRGKYFKQNGQFAESFRLRRKDEKVYITHKHDIFDRKDKWIYSDELEAEVKDFHIAEKIVKALGMKKLVDLRILKRTFKTREYEIVLESVRGLGLFLEVEALRIRKGETVKEVKNRIWQFIKNLQVKTSQELGIGKAELVLMKKKDK